MELFAGLFTTIGVGGIALFILWQSNRDRAAEDLRRYEEKKLDREDRREDRKEFLLMMATLMSKQEATTMALEKSEMRVTAKFDDVRDDIVEGFRDWQEFSNMYMKMLLENPPATRPRLKRAMEAYSQGDMIKAQAIADEEEKGDAPPATVSASGKISEAPAPIAEVRQ